METSGENFSFYRRVALKKGGGRKEEISLYELSCTLIRETKTNKYNLRLEA